MAIANEPQVKPEKRRLSKSIDLTRPDLSEQSADQPIWFQDVISDSTLVQQHDEDDDHDQSLVRKITVLGAVILPLLAMIAVIVMATGYGYFSWLNLIMLVGGWYLTGLGITIGFHRMLTHRSFEAKPWVSKFWTALGSLAVEGSPTDWCMVHRKHHRFSDHDGDPHSPHLHEGGFWNSLKGFWHSHTGWMIQSSWSRKERSKYVPDMLKDPFLVSIDNRYYWWVTATMIIPTVIGGLATWSMTGAWLGLLWGGFARVCLSHHMTWSINSICHIFGSQDYRSADDSKNNVVFGVLSHGEGWHNNHHAFPTSAKHGLKWWQFDLSWVIIRGMEMCGLVWNVKLPSDRQLESREIE